MAFETKEQMNRLDMKLRSELGPEIVDALASPDVLEICVNSDGSVWVEEKGKPLYDTGNLLPSGNLLAALGTVAAMNGSELNGVNPILQGRLPLDGSRIEGAIYPASPEGPSMSIRKHASAIFPLSRYVEEGRIGAAGAEYLRQAIRDALNVLVSGGTSSGKTTFVNALIAELVEMSPYERLIVIEDTLELQCAAKNRQRFVAAGPVTMRDLVKASMRYRPDRIIIGEVRDAAALELLKSWNTGHPGGFATIHANSALAALPRMEQLILETAPNPMRALIGETVNVVVHMRQFGRLGRQVAEILRVTGYDSGKEAYLHESVYDAEHLTGTGEPRSGNEERG
jgi:type IV secretion system protein VirB11